MAAMAGFTRRPREDRLLAYDWYHHDASGRCLLFLGSDCRNSSRGKHLGITCRILQACSWRTSRVSRSRKSFSFPYSHCRNCTQYTMLMTALQLKDFGSMRRSVPMAGRSKRIVRGDSSSGGVIEYLGAGVLASRTFGGSAFFLREVSCTRLIYRGPSGLRPRSATLRAHNGGEEHAVRS